VDADVALAAYNVREPRHPLLLSMQANFMKLFLSDVGLLTSLCGMDVVRDTLNSKPGVNYGALYENAIAQEITAQGFKLFYFKNKKLGELDFVLEHRNGEVIPIEVKSGKDYNRHRALDNVLEVSSFGINQAIVFHEGNTIKKSTILYLPVYMVSCLSCGEDLG
jgi:predicted AAA+ superfamily ATPase